MQLQNTCQCPTSYFVLLLQIRSNQRMSHYRSAFHFQWSLQSLKEIVSFPQGNILFPRKNYLRLERQYLFPKGDSSVPEENILFPERNSDFVPGKELYVPEIGLRIARFSTSSISQCRGTAKITSQRFPDRFPGENSIHDFKKPKNHFTKRHWVYCLNAAPDY